MTSAETAFFSNLSGELSAQDRFDLFHGYVQELGFTDAFYARQVVGDPHWIGRFVFRHWDPAWMKLYAAKGYEKIDWAIQAVLTHRQPFRFDRPKFALTKAQLQFAADAMRHNRQNGFAVPIHGAVGPVAGFSVTGCKTRPTEEQMNRVIAAGHLLDMFMRPFAKEMSARMLSLSQREVRLIGFLGDGMNAVRIAERLGTSEQWIRKSFMRIREKLQVASNPELLLKAHELDLL